MSYKTYYNRYTSLLLPFLSIFFILTPDWAQALRPYLLTPELLGKSPHRITGAFTLPGTPPH
jgi:hypothetical protein